MQTEQQGVAKRNPLIATATSRASLRSRAAVALALAFALFGCGGGDGGDSGSSSSAPFGGPITSDFGGRPLALAWADFDGDGKLDIAFTLSAGGLDALYVALGNGDGTFQPPLAIAGIDSVGAIAVGDLNGDRKPDLAAVGSGGCFVPTGVPACPPLRLFVMLGHGDASFAPPIAYDAGPAYGWNSVAIADFDGDGRLDVAVAQTAPIVSVFFGNGDGSLQPRTEWAHLGFSNTEGISVADLNGDGMPDITAFYPSAFSSAMSVLLARGGRAFEETMPPGGTPFRALQRQYADFNGDGNLDLALTGDRFRGPGRLAVLLGNGDGTFQSATFPDYPVAYDNGTFAVGDVDRDGKLDIVVRPAATSELYILYGNGDATFAEAQPQPLALDGATVARLVDLNGDGRLDLVLVTPTGIAVLLGAR